MKPNPLNIVDAKFIAADKALIEGDMFRHPFGFSDPKLLQVVVQVLFAGDEGDGNFEPSWSLVYITVTKSEAEAIDHKVKFGIVDSSDATYIVEKLCRAAGLSPRRRSRSGWTAATPARRSDGARTDVERLVPISWPPPFYMDVNDRED